MNREPSGEPPMTCYVCGCRIGPASYAGAWQDEEGWRHEVCALQVDL